MHQRSMLVVAAVSLFLLVGIVGLVLVNGSSSSPPLPASNAAAKCQTPTGPTARGYGETGTGVTAADPDCHSACEPAAADGPTARGYGESGAANVAPTCGPCPNQPAGPTGRGYGESGVGSVLSDECADDASDHRDETTAAPPTGGGNGPTGSAAAPLTGGGGAHGGAVPGATGRAAPRSVDAAEHGPSGQPLSTPLSAAVVAQAPNVEGGRKNTALVVGGLVLLLVAVAVVLRRGRPGTAW